MTGSIGLDMVKASTLRVRATSFMLMLVSALISWRPAFREFLSLCDDPIVVNFLINFQEIRKLQVHSDLKKVPPSLIQSYFDQLEQGCYKNTELTAILQNRGVDISRVSL